MQRSVWAGWGGVVLALLMAACGARPDGDQAAAPAEVRNDPQWAQYLAEVTAGTVSRGSQIRLRFVSDVVDAAAVGTPQSGLLSVEPAIVGELVFNNPRELVLVPKAPLTSGQRYRLTLHGGQLAALPPVLGDYRFVLDVIPQGLDLRVDNIAPDRARSQAMVVSGQISTADMAEADAVEQTLKASLGEQPVQLHWNHSADGRRHGFRTAAVMRAAAAQNVQLRWDGAPIGAEASGERSLEVPPLDAFGVARYGFDPESPQTLVVDFSDPLDPKQDLKGLVALSAGEFSARIEGHRLKLFPAKLSGNQVELSLSEAIRSVDGRRLGTAVQHTVLFEVHKPGVRFVGQGAILPDADSLSIPFEAINVAAVQVTAFRVYEDNIGQFLQVNPLAGQQELKRVGRYLWKKSIPLGNGRLNEWRRFAFDVSALYRDEPGALYRFTLSIHRGNSLYACSEADRDLPVPADPLPANGDDYDEYDASGWDFAEYYGWAPSEGSFRWEDRENPCKDGYFRFNEQTRSSRNFIAANIGLIAKSSGDGEWRLAATDLRRGQPLPGTQLILYNYQGQELAKAVADQHGLATLRPEVRPFYLEARHASQRGYLKLSEGLALPMSHFDVGGVAVERGIKGTLYGERGVWRPGDTLYLTFVLQDPKDAIPDGHPATLELINPQGQTVYSQTHTQPVADFYSFAMATSDSDPTGNWRARVLLGGRSFERLLKIETVMPNRLKIELETGAELRRGQSAGLSLFSQWLHGASAAGLKADLAVKLKPRPTQFTRNSDFVFEDPTRKYSGEEQKLWEGELDAEGRAAIEAEIGSEGAAPGFLTADFTTRVFEPGGAFSIAGQSVPFHPYSHYVGIKLPKGDLARGMLLTDQSHTVEIATLAADGAAADLTQLEVSLYKLDWRWWWEQGGDGLASFASSETQSLLQKGIVSSSGGAAQWQFEVKYPDWGRYLVRACDLDGGHCSAQVVYIDWPGWAGRAAEQGGPGANTLQLAADKASYTVGEVAQIQLPAASSGRALLSVETGSGILSQSWLELGPERSRFELPISAVMAPNVYVNVTLLQPHEGKDNDRPIRLYGALPILVNDPATHLAPRIELADEVRPETELNIKVSEQQGRAMTYTLAVVDEGLLGLTRFQTPRLHGEFYRREALGVKTWDLFDDVVGAYGGALEKLLALGGSDEGLNHDANKDRKRFPPVVRFIGPFQLAAGAASEHKVALPPYIGAVRVMLVAGQAGAYGQVEKTVTVRQPLMLQATLPRVLGPGESLRMPVAVFALDDRIREVAITAAVEGPLQLPDGGAATLMFQRSGDQLAFLPIKVGEALGPARVRVRAESGSEYAEQVIDIAVRASNPESRVLQRQVIAAGEAWKVELLPHGLAGTRSVQLEASSVPPLNLNDRLRYLIQYPHGCVEQTTSAAFPQVFLPKLLQLDHSEAARVQQHVLAGIERLRQYQQVGGGFGYWPGAVDWNSWSSSYVGHFLLEAQRQGYAVPAAMLANWRTFQTARAQVWLAGNREAALDQAYRLYTLALAGAPELGAMNRLREQKALDNVARWLLAAGYRQAGLDDVARNLAADGNLEVKDYPHEGLTYGSALRDRAILLESLLGIGDAFRSKELAESIAAELAGERWYSTHSLSWSLLALAHFVGDGAGQGVAFEYAFRGADWQRRSSERPIVQVELGDADAPRELHVRNPGSGPLYLNLVSRGMAPAGEETAAAESLQLQIRFTDSGGQPVDPARLPQGQDLRAELAVKNTASIALSNLALSALAPSGWEIVNTRLAATGSAISEAAFDYRDVRDDRVHTYFGLNPGEEKRFVLPFTASYPGRYYLPAWNVEAMYDATRFARSRGQWVEVEAER